MPLWSPRILAEWQLAAARLGDPGTEAAAQAISDLRAEWPEAETKHDPALTAGLILPDRSDEHVVGAAIAGRADLILTLNLRDFPARALAPLGLRARAPDELLMALWLDRPDAVEHSVNQAIARAADTSGRRVPLRAVLKRARLPRLAKALDEATAATARGNNSDVKPR